MRLQTAVNTSLIAAVILSVAVGCATKEKDPLDDIKSLIPKIEAGLNRRDLAGLQKLGTERFQSNALVVDVFDGRINDSVHVSLSRIQQTGADATLIVNLMSHETPGERRELHLHLQGGERWAITSYEIGAVAADSGS